jgi:surface protein
MFKNCKSLIELDISSFDTSNVTNMYQLFYNCVTLKYLYVGEGWNIGNVKNGAQAFSCCDALPGFDPNNSAVDIGSADKYVKPEEEKPKPETKMYTVTYEVIGDIPEGVTAPGAAAYEEGTTVTVAESPSADKYIFSGWTTDDAAVENGEFVINNDVEFVFNQFVTLLDLVVKKLGRGFLTHNFAGFVGSKGIAGNKEGNGFSAVILIGKVFEESFFVGNLGIAVDRIASDRVFARCVGVRIAYVNAGNSRNCRDAKHKEQCGYAKKFFHSSLRDKINVVTFLCSIVPKYFLFVKFNFANYFDICTLLCYNISV